MAKDYIEYVEFDDNELCPLNTVKCMNCGIVIGKRKERSFDHLPVFSYFSNTKRKRYFLEDNTYIDIMLCDKCINTSIDINRLEKTLKYGWKRESQWKYEDSKSYAHKQIKLKRLGLKEDEKLPLSYFKQLFKGKKILNKEVN